MVGNIRAPAADLGLPVADGHKTSLSSLTRQCVAGRRFGDAQTLRAETSAWSSDVNGTQRGVDWPMKLDDARYKLASVYPKIKL
jgi:hypothetical protein